MTRWLIPVLLSAGLPAQDFSTAARLVLMDVVVTERESGGAVDDLLAGDFAVFDNGVRVPVAVFEWKEKPVDAVLVLDATYKRVSRAGDALAEWTRAVVGQMRPGDRLGVVSFGATPRVLAPLSDDEDAAQRAISEALQAKERGSPSILEAIETGASLFFGKRSADRERLLIVITPNLEKTSPQSIQAATDAVWEADAIVVGIVIPQDDSGIQLGFGGGVFGGPSVRREPKPKPPKPELQSIDPVVAASGGQMLRPPTTPGGLKRVFETLRASYVLGFYAAEPAGPGERHELRVVVTDPRTSAVPVDVRNRTGYVLK